MSAVVAGLVAVLVSYTGPLVVVVQAARAGGLDEERLSSWIWAISVGSGAVGLVLSLALKAPVIAAWSTPGAALLVTALPKVSPAAAVGAYLVAAALTVVVGLSGMFSVLMERIPSAVVSGMLAGVLLRFGLSAFSALPTAPVVVGSVLAAYLAARRLLPRYSLVAALVGGALGMLAAGSRTGGHPQLALAVPQLQAPQFTLGAAAGIGIPLFLVAMTSQNAPGIAVMRAASYRVPADRVVLATGIASAALAPFGSPGINLAAITAAICTGPDAHPDPDRRYVAGVSCGLCYLVVGSFGATVASVFGVLPAALTTAVASVALFGALTNALAGAMEHLQHREAGLITFLVTGSGLSLAGLGAPFWGLALGTATALVLRPPTSTQPATATVTPEGGTAHLTREPATRRAGAPAQQPKG